MTNQSDFKLSRETAIRYLNIYVADLNWNPHIKDFYDYAYKKCSNDTEATRAFVRKSLCAAILMSSMKLIQVPDEDPYKILFWCTKWSSFDETDWVAQFRKVLREDEIIKDKRASIMEQGVYKSINFLPITTQAFNWLFSRAKDSKCINDKNEKNIIERYRTFVSIYGGMNISNMFENDKYKSGLSKIPSWRYAYFFEKEMHRVYKLEQLMRVKKDEFSKVDKMYIYKLEAQGEF